MNTTAFTSLHTIENVAIEGHKGELYLTTMETHEVHSLGEIMGGFQVMKNRGGINAPFNDAVERVRTAIPDQPWNFGRWCGFLRGIPPYEIQSMIASAEKSDNPGRKFNWLVKQYREEQRTKTSTV